MKTINFLNRKGGVGKTVIAANIAYEMARSDLVLILDLDSQCDITEFFFNLNIPENIGPSAWNIRNVLQNDCSIEDACIEVADNLFLVPGSPDLDDFDFKYSQKALRDKLQAEGLKEVDYVIIDNPPSINEAVRCGLVASDHVVIVTEAENPAMTNLKKVNQQLEAIRQKLNPDLNTLGIVLNKIDQRRNLTQRNIEELKRQYQEALFDTWLSIDTSIPNSFDQRVPVRELRWRSRTVSQFQWLLQEMRLRMGEMEVKNESAQ